MRVDEIQQLINAADNGDNLEVRVENRMAMSDAEENTIRVERVITPDYIRISRLYPMPRPTSEQRKFHAPAKHKRV